MNKKATPVNKALIAAVIAIIAIVVCIVIVIKTPDPVKEQAERTPSTLRIAWMTSWATTGQIVEAMIHNDYLGKKEVDVEFKSFLFGPPMNEAAITGQADVTIVGDMPAIILLSNSNKFSVISRTIYFPYALMVRTDLDVKDISELQGMTVGVPFGSGPQPTLYRWLKDSGLEIGKTVQVVNILPNEMSEAIRTKRVDAIMSWEPAMTLLEQDGAARVLKNAKGVGFMVAANTFVDEYPEIIEKLVESWQEALFFTAQHSEETDRWFSEDSRMAPELLAKIRVVDDNLSATKLEDVDVTLTEADIQKNQIKADFALSQGLISKPLDISSRVKQP